MDSIFLCLPSSLPKRGHSSCQKSSLTARKGLGPAVKRSNPIQPEVRVLDSIDALQIAVGVEQKFGFPLKDPEVARQVLKSLGSLREWLIRQQEAA